MSCHRPKGCLFRSRIAKPTFKVGLNPEQIEILTEKQWHRHAITLVFRDGRGKRWVRWPHGELARVYGLFGLADLKSDEKTFVLPWAVAETAGATQSNDTEPPEEAAAATDQI